MMPSPALRERPLVRAAAAGPRARDASRRPRVPAAAPDQVSPPCASRTLLVEAAVNCVATGFIARQKNRRGNPSGGKKSIEHVTGTRFVYEQTTVKHRHRLPLLWCSGWYFGGMSEVLSFPLLQVVLPVLCWADDYLSLRACCTALRDLCDQLITTAVLKISTDEEADQPAELPPRGTRL